MTEHHPIFSHFEFSLHEQKEGLYIDGLGVRTRASFMDMSKWHIQFKATALPEIGETYFKKPKVKKIEAVTLSSILDKLDSVDLLDIDIQGAEMKVVESSIQQMTDKVKCAHIGTHGEDIEVGLRNVLKSLAGLIFTIIPRGRSVTLPLEVLAFKMGYSLGAIHF